MTTAPPPGPVRPAATRKSVPLTPRDLADLAMIGRSPSARAALGVAENASEAAVLHGILALGLEEARRMALDQAHDALAVSYRHDPEEAAARQAMRRRRRLRSDRPGDEG